MMDKIAVVGAGNWGKNLIRVFDRLGVLWGYADSDLDRLADLRKYYPAARTFRTLDEIIEEGEVSAVAIVTPAETHYPLCRLALEAGLHLFVEKPLALNSDHALELLELADRRGLVFMVGHLMLYHPAVRYIKGLVESGELGDSNYFYGQRVNPGRIGPDESALWSLGPHDVSIVMHLFEKRPVQVSAIGSGSGHKQDGEDVVFLNLLFDDGKMANVHLSFLDRNKIRRMTMVGKRKTLVFDDMETDKIRIYDKWGSERDQDLSDSHGDLITLTKGGVEIPSIEMVEPLKVELHHFLRCIQNGEKPLTDGRSGLDVLRVLEAAQASLSKDGAPVCVEYIEPTSKIWTGFQVAGGV